MKRLAWIALALVAVAAGLAFFIFDFPRQPSNDMAPNLRKGDLVLACRVCGASRGDVVLFSVPGKPAMLSLRRVVAIPGDEVEVRRGRVLVNGAPLDDQAAGTLTIDDVDGPATGPRGFEAAWETVGAHRFRVLRDLAAEPFGDRPKEKLDDAYFVLADRRTRAGDSREYGPVRRADVRSRALRLLSKGESEPGRPMQVP